MYSSSSINTALITHFFLITRVHTGANYSCQNCIGVKLLTKFSWCVERQKITGLTAIDLLAAFDTTDHEILLKVLQIKFGFTGHALHWFDSYLRPRGFQVFIEGQRSEIINLSFSDAPRKLWGPMYCLAYCLHPTGMSCLDDLELDLHGFTDDHAYTETL